MTLNVGFVIFPYLTQLDFTGPLQVFHRLPGSRTQIAARSLDPVLSDCAPVVIRDDPAEAVAAA